MIEIITTGGTIDKVYFDKKSDYQVGDPFIGDLLTKMNVNVNYISISIDFIIKNNLLNSNKTIIPLGGIKSSNLNKLKLIKSFGIAVMSEIKKKPTISSRLF